MESPPVTSRINVEDDGPDLWMPAVTRSFLVVLYSLAVSFAGIALPLGTVYKSFSEPEVQLHQVGIKLQLHRILLVLSLLLCTSGFLESEAKSNNYDKALFVCYVITSVWTVMNFDTLFPALIGDNWSRSYLLSLATGFCVLGFGLGLSQSSLHVAETKSLIGGCGFFFYLHWLLRHYIWFGTNERPTRWIDLDPRGFLTFDCREISIWLSFALFVSAFVPPGLIALLSTALCSCGYYGLFWVFFWDANTKELRPRLEKERFNLAMCSCFAVGWCLVSCFYQVHEIHSGALPMVFSPLASPAKHINFTLGMGSVYYVRLLVNSRRIWHFERINYAFYLVELFCVINLFMLLWFELILSLFINLRLGKEGEVPPRFWYAAIEFTCSIGSFITEKRSASRRHYWYRNRRKVPALIFSSTSIVLASLTLYYEAKLRNGENFYTAERKVAYLLSLTIQTVQLPMLIFQERQLPR